MPTDSVDLRDSGALSEKGAEKGFGAKDLGSVKAMGLFKGGLVTLDEG